MNSQIRNKLDRLRANYEWIIGFPFTHLYCPILFRDEDAPIYKAHIINRAFSHSSRKWTVQRKDVDEFYGSNFEAEFFALQYKENRSIAKTFTDKPIYRTFSPKISIDNQPIEYFIARGGDVPEQFTPVLFEDDDRQAILLGIKLSPEEFKSIEGQKLEIEISKDVRVPTLVSLIKAAHLTLFEMIGFIIHFRLEGILLVGRY